MTNKILRNFVGSKIGSEPLFLFKTKAAVDTLANKLKCSAKEMHDYHVDGDEHKSPIKLLFEQKETNPSFNKIPVNDSSKLLEDDNKLELMKPPEKNASVKYNKKDEYFKKFHNDIYNSVISQNKTDRATDEDASTGLSPKKLSYQNSLSKKTGSSLKNNDSPKDEKPVEVAETEMNIPSKEGHRVQRSYKLRNLLRTNVDQGLSGVRCANSMPPARHHHVKATIEAVVPKGLLRFKDTLMPIDKKIKEKIAVQDGRKANDYKGIFGWNHPPPLPEMNDTHVSKKTERHHHHHHIGVRTSGLAREYSKKTIGRWNVFKTPDASKEIEKQKDEVPDKNETYTSTEALLKVCPKPIPDSLYSCRYNHIFYMNTA